MFFSISKQVNNDFPNHVKWGEFCVDFDNGWTVSANLISKGYPGKSCEIRYSDIGIELTSGNRQTFPIFIAAYIMGFRSARSFENGIIAKASSVKIHIV